MQASPGVVTYLFTDIEGSTRLWEQQPEAMRRALARHDEIVKAVIERQRGLVVKTAGDGVHAVFDDPADAVGAAVALQQALADPQTTAGIALRVRCGMHAGVDERRGGDYFGQAVNRAARIMSVAHGGQVLLSAAVAALVGVRLPARVTLRDLGAVRLRDLATSENVYQVVHPELRRDFPALRSLEATPNNLPQQVASFVGRERELAQVRDLLDTSRLVTLIGVGGIGKTRLSLQVAADVLDDFPDGVWLVELAALSDPQLVPQAVASVFGVKEDAGRPIVETLAKFAKDRELLLILDNCEHLVHASAELARRLVEAAPKLKILASSREHLNIAGETSHPLPALATPSASAALTAAALSEFESVRLFVDRAVAAQPAFALTERNAAAVSDICRRLDGIPLAIELAAARVRALSVENIAARLNDRFRLLTSGSRSSLPRQQTLRALIDWSYELLSDEERALFRRLAVFAGGWTLEAAEAVCAGDQGAPDAVGLLANLVEKSLVVLEAGGERYRLLETVRHYAQEHLAASGEEDEIRGRHFAFFLRLAEHVRAKLDREDQGAWLERLESERENLLAAHAWCDHGHEDDAGEEGLRLVSALKPYWIHRGLLGLGSKVTTEALMRPGAAARGLPRCRGLFNAGQLACWMGRYAEARVQLEESLAIARELDHRERVAQVLQPLGMAAIGQGDLAAARRYLDEGLVLAQQLGDRRELAAAFNAMGQLDRIEGALDKAEPIYEQVVALGRELGDRESIAIGLLNLAMVSIGRGSAERARAPLLEVLAIATEIGSRPAGQSALEVSAGLAARQSDWRRAARLFGVAEAQAELTGLHRDPTDEAFLAPLIAKARAELADSEFRSAEASGRALSYEDALVETRAWLAHPF